MFTADAESFWRGYPQCLRRLNVPLLVLVAALAVIGTAFIYGTGQQTGGAFSGMWKRQIMWIIVGTCGVFFLARLDYEWLGKLSWLAYSVGIILLIVVLTPLGTTINNANSWISIAGVTVQPAEFAKFGLILVLCWLASREWVDLKNVLWAFPFIGLTAIPMLLIAMQPDLGSASTMGPVLATVLFVGGLRWRWFIIPIVLFIIGLVILATVASNDERPDKWVHYGAKIGMKEYQVLRIETFFNPERDIAAAGWNAHQSMLAVGSGGMWGKGFMQGTQNTLGFLPRKVAPTDFIFSVIAEETGFIGSSVLILMFCFLVLTIGYIAARSRDEFGRLLACSICVLLSAHVYVNIGMTMGMAPIIGIPLPFVSYGGSFMLVMLAFVGLLQSIYIRRKTL